MKEVSKIVLVAGICFFVVGCDKGTDKAAIPNESVDSTAAPVSTVPKESAVQTKASIPGLEDLKLLADKGDTSAGNFIGLVDKAERGDKGAQYIVGAYYRDGVVIKQDFPQAFHWLSESAKQGQQGAQWILGVMYENGESVPVDLEKAAYWYEKSAKGSDQPAVERARQSLDAVKHRMAK